MEKNPDAYLLYVAADYRNDVGCPESYLDFVRFIHVKYDWNTEDLSVEQLNERARCGLTLDAGEVG